MNKLMVSLAVVLAGCAQVFGIDDYASSATDAGPLAERGPFLAGSSCQRCVMAHCGEQNAACAADNSCTQLFADKKVNSGPIADYRRRYLPPVSDQLWAWQHGQASADPIANMEERMQCIEAYCSDSCELGRDFSCVGAFDWPETAAGPKKLRVNFSTETAKTDWDVEFCLSTGACGGSSFHAQTDSQGFAELIIDTPALPLALNGYIAANTSDPSAYPFTFILRPAPLETGLYFFEHLLSKGAVDEPYTALGGKLLTSDRGAVWVYPTDCRGDKARHVQVDYLIASEPGRGYAACTDCVPTIYTNDAYYPDAARKELASLGGRAILTDLPLRYLLVVVRDTVSRVVIGSQQLLVRGGFVHIVRIYPASRRELAELPIGL